MHSRRIADGTLGTNSAMVRDVGQTFYSHAVRIFTCEKCGAPIDASVNGGSFTCSYCEAVNHLARRDESADLSAANAGRVAGISESERYTRLRSQDRQPTPIPEAIAALLTRDELAKRHVEEAKTLWREARSELAISQTFPVCERLFHLTVILAPRLGARELRASLETAVELLPDAGHRHVLRCMLAREAAQERDYAAAEAWLAPVNPRPTDLREDTAYREAAATLASAQGQYERVAELLGFRRDDVPLADRDELPCWILRIDALENLDRLEAAVDELRQIIEVSGEARVRTIITRKLSLALVEKALPAALARIAQANAEAAAKARAARARDEADARAARARDVETSLRDLQAKLAQRPGSLLSWLSRVGLVSFAIAVVFGTIWTCVLSGMVETDPLLGAHAAVYCETVCDDCVPPYRFVSWSTTTNNNSSSSTLNIYCSDAGGRMATMDEQVFTSASISEEPWLARYEVGGGIWLLMFTMWWPMVPVGLVLTLLVAFRGNRRRAAERRQQEARVGELRDELARLRQ